MERYKYYSTQRPVDMGTFPTPPDNKPLEINNYDKREPVEGGKLQAWGDLTYAKPLTKKQMADYELKPAPDNPDLQRAAAPLKDNDDVKKLLALLSKVEGDRAKEFSQLIKYVDTMEKRFDLVSAELMQVRGQLADMQQGPVKKALSAAVTGIESGVRDARKELGAIKERIAAAAARAVESVKHTGLSALNKTLSFIGIKDMLNDLRGGLNYFIDDTKDAISKVEAIGEELRSAGGHLKQAGRATIGKERQEVDASKEGRFQAGLLAPLRAVRDTMAGIEKTAGAAVGQLEKLEQAAEKKPSVRENLQALKKVEKPDKAGPAKVKAEPEAAL
jgi:hypothetical protein